MKKLAAAALLTGMGTVLMAAPAAAVHEGSRYTSTLTEVANNDPGNPTGTASFTVSDDGETMSVTLNASGLGNFPHALHFHAVVNGEEVASSSCPTIVRDTNGDGVVDVAEGAPDYGGVVVSLTTEGDTSPDSALAVDRFPSGTSISYSRSGIPIPANLKPNLGKLHFVVHGVDENQDGELTMDQEERSSLTADLPREATLPALCGTVSPAAALVSTGDGSAATTGNIALSAMGATLIAGGAAMGLRRRGSEA